MSLMNVPAPSGHRLCRHLRCKEMYYTAHEEAGGAERARPDPATAFANKYFWCLRTFKADGPEGAPCGPEECPPGRSCYEA